MITHNSSSNFSSLCSNSSINNCSSSGASQILNLKPLQIAGVVVTAVIILLGVPANVAVIVKLGRHLRGSSMTQRLFFNLAVSDLLCLLGLPIDFVVFDIGPDLKHEGICELVSYLVRFCVTCDRNILVLISVQRYYQVLHPKKWDKVGQRCQHLLFFGVWMLGALIALPVVFFTEDVENEGHSCRNHRVTPAFEMVYVLFIVFSYLVLLFFYLLLVRGVKRAQIPNRKEPRVTKLFIRIIAVSLLAGFVPLIFRMFTMAAKFCSFPYNKKLNFVVFLYFINHCLNPFLYFFASRQRSAEGNRRGCLSMFHNGKS